MFCYIHTRIYMHVHLYTPAFALVHPVSMCNSEIIDSSLEPTETLVCSVTLTIPLESHAVRTIGGHSSNSAEYHFTCTSQNCYKLEMDLVLSQHSLISCALDTRRKEPFSHRR